MAARFARRFVNALALLATCLIPVNASRCQDDDVNRPPGFVAVDGDNQQADLRKEIEPGIVLFGKSHRFAEVGDCQVFDSSPDGRTLVFAAGKLKFFDLRNNKVTGVAGAPSEHYQGVVYSPDGRFVFAQTFVAGNSLVRVFDAIDKSSVGTITTRKDASDGPSHFQIQQICVSADANYLALASHNEVQVREVETGKLVCSLDQLGYVQGMAFSPDETRLFVPKQGRLVVIDLETGEAMKKSESMLVNQRSNSIAVNLPRKLGAIAHNAGVTIFDFEENESKGMIPLKKTSLQSVAFSDDGSLLAINAWQHSNDGYVAVVVVADVEKGQVEKTISVAAQGITRSRFATDNKSLFISGHGIYVVQEVQLDGQEQVSKSRYPVGPAKTAVIHPDGKSFVTCSQGGEVTWFDISDGEVLRSIRKSNVLSAELTEDGTMLFLVSQWGNSEPIASFDFESGEKAESYAIKSATDSVFSHVADFLLEGGPTFNRHSQAFAIDAKLTTNSAELNALIFETSYRQVIGLSSRMPEQEFAIRFSRLDVETGKRLASVRIDPTDYSFAENEWIQQGAVRSDGSQFAIARQNQIFVVDAETSEAIADYKIGDHGWVACLQYSPDGKFMAASNHQGLWVWNAVTGEEVKNFESGGTPLFSFSKNGSRLVVCPVGKTTDVEVFDTGSWKQVLNRNKTEANRRCVILSDDGQQLLIGLADCRVELWDLALVGQ